MGNSAVTGGLFGGGETLGTAHGAIVIDTAQLLQAVQVARQSARQIEAAFSQVERGTQKAEKGVKSLGAQLGGLGSTFAGGLAALAARQVATTTFELARAAAEAERSRQAFGRLSAGIGENADQMLASMERASEGMIGSARLIQTANQAMLLNAADTGEEIGQLIEIARVRAEASGKSFEDAFSRLALGIGKREAEILDELGLVLRLAPAYEAYAAELGKSANDLTSLEQTQALFNEVLRQSQGLLAQSSQGIDNNAKHFDRAAAASQNFRQALGNLFTGEIAQAAKTYADLLTEITRLLNSLEGAGAGGEAFGTLEARRFGANPAGPGAANSLAAAGLRQDIRNAEFVAARLTEGLQLLQRQGGDRAAIERQLGLIAENNNQLALLRQQLALQTMLTGQGAGQRITASGFGVPGTGLPQAQAAVDAEGQAKQRQAKLDFERSMQEIEAGAQRQRLDATRSYEQQRTQVIASYERQISREAEDFARQRARALADFERQIERVGTESRAREADWAADLASRLADLQEATAERLFSVQEEAARRQAANEERYQRERERAERDHRDRLLDAAARLDAGAVFAEQKRFARERQTAEEAHRDQQAENQRQLAERIEQERQNLAERIQQEQEAHAERVASAREQDEERLADMRRDFDERLRQEDEERAIRLARQAEDHAAQLGQMATAHADRLTQISQHAADERKQLTDEHLRLMDQLKAILPPGYKAIITASEQALLAAYDEFTAELAKRFAVQGALTREQAARQPWGGLDLSDPLWRPRPAPVSTRSSSVSLAPGAIQVFAAPGQSAYDVARAVRAEMLEVFRELAQ